MKDKPYMEMSNGFLGTIWQMWLAGIINERHIEMSLSLHDYKLAKIDDKHIVATKENETFSFYSN